MARKDHPARPDGGGVLELLFNILGDLEGFCGFVRLAGHVLLLVVRAVFHLLTCHF